MSVEDDMTHTCAKCQRPFVSPSRKSRFCSTDCYHAARHDGWEARFWNKVLKTDGCWLWAGCLTTKGYGQLTWQNRRRAAHRVSWGIAYGEIPKGIEVCHHCDVPRCVRPDHLFLGSHRENMQDAQNKGRMRLVHHKGTKHGMSKLSEAAIKEIWAFRGLKPQRALAEQFGVERSTISKVYQRKNWKWLPSDS